MRSIRAFSLILALFSSLLIVIGSYGGFSEAVAEDLSLSAETSDNVNAVLLMDSSASMLVNDPAKLRDQGARLLLQFLKSGDKLAIVSFDADAHVVRPLSPFSSDQLPALQTSLNSIEANGQYTDLNAGLQSAQSILSKLPANDGKSVIILLSDGKMDPAPSAGTAEHHLDQLTTQILPLLKTSKTKVYTLAFSQDADRALLQHIAQATDAINWFTPNSDTIHESFADLFLSLKKPQVVPYGSKGFKIDADIEEATFYINQPEDVKIQIENPDGEKFSAQEPGDDIRWFDGKKFSVITIMHPMAGEWKLIGVNPDDGFATILTNLKLVTDWPNAIPVDETALLQARLYEGKIPVDLEAMAQAVSFAFQITPSDRVSEPILRDFLNDDGKNGDEKARDGIFSQKIKISDAGEYRLRLVAKGPTFERQLQIPFRVRPPLITLSVDQNLDEEKTPDVHSEEHKTEKHEEYSHKEHADREEHASHDEHPEQKPPPDKRAVIDGSQYAIFNVSLNEEASTLKNITVVVTAIDKDRNKYSLPTKLHASEHSEENQVYQVSAATLPKDGLFDLKASLEAKSRDGKQVSDESAVVKFSRKTIVALAGKEIEKKPDAEETPAAPKEVKPVEAGFEWLALIIVTIINLMLGGLLFVLLKKKKSQSVGAETFELPAFPPELTGSLDDLEKRAQLDAVNLDDDRYALSESDAGAAAATAAEAPRSQGENSDTAG